MIWDYYSLPIVLVPRLDIARPGCRQRQTVRLLVLFAVKSLEACPSSPSNAITCVFHMSGVGARRGLTPFRFRSQALRIRRLQHTFMTFANSIALVLTEVQLWSSNLHSVCMLVVSGYDILPAVTAWPFTFRLVTASESVRRLLAVRNITVSVSFLCCCC